MRGTSGEVEAADMGTAMGEAALAHEARGHHRVHALAVEVKIDAPLCGDARGEYAKIRDVFAPPGFAEQPIEVLALALLAEPLGLREIHRSKEPGGRPAVTAERGVHDRGSNQKAAALCFGQ